MTEAKDRCTACELDGSSDCQMGGAAIKEMRRGAAKVEIANKTESLRGPATAVRKQQKMGVVEASKGCL